MYCCAVLDAWSRRVVGQATGPCQRADLATGALGMATGSRAPAASSMVTTAPKVDTDPAGTRRWRGCREPR